MPNKCSAGLDSRLRGNDNEASSGDDGDNCAEGDKLGLDRDLYNLFLVCSASVAFLSIFFSLDVRLWIPDSWTFCRMRSTSCWKFCCSAIFFSHVPDRTFDLSLVRQDFDNT